MAHPCQDPKGHKEDENEGVFSLHLPSFRGHLSRKWLTGREARVRVFAGIGTGAPSLPV